MTLIRRPLAAMMMAGLLLAVCAQAQNTTPGAFTPAGLPSAPASGTGFEQYNSFNGYLTASVPLHHIGGRGEAGMDLVWNLQPNWTAAYNGIPGGGGFLFAQPYPSLNIAGTNNSAFGLGGPGAVYIRTGYSWNYCGNTGGYAVGSSVTSVVYVMPNGGQLSLTDTATHGAAASPPVNACTTQLPSTWDASRGYQFSSTDNSQIQFLSLNNADVLEQAPNSHGYGVATVSGTLVFPSGARYNIVDSQIMSIEDRNGNEISLAYGGPAVNIDWYLQITALTQVTDSLGNVTSIGYSNPSSLSITYPGAGGNSRVVTVNTGSLSSNLRSGYSTTTIGQLFSSSLFGGTNPYNPTVASSISLPDGSSYTFSYNQYGELARVVLPTGGAVEYDYAAGDGDTSGGYIAPSGSGGAVMIYRRLTERREYVSGGSGSSYSSRTDHALGTVSGGITDTVNVYAPDGTQLSQTVHTFSGNPTDVLSMTGTSCNNSLEGVETQTTSGLGALLTVTNTYTNGAGSCLNNPQLTSVVTKNDAGQTAQTTYTYDNYSNVSEEKEYDWSSNGGGLLRDVINVYWYQQNSAYSEPGVNLVRLPWYTTIKDAQANQVAETVWQYDYIAPTIIPLVAGRDGAYSSTSLSSPLRGNVNYIYRWVSGSTLLGDSFTYDIAGNILSHGYDNGTTTYTYNDDGKNLYAFPTTITDGANQATKMTYDYNIGKPTNVQDARGNNTGYQYNDPLDRLTLTTEPTGAWGEIGYASPTWIIYSHSLNTQSDQSVQSQVVYDGFGRDIEDRQFTASNYLIAVDHVYDALGRMTSQSNPSQVYIPTWTNDNLAFLTTYAYDSLNRLTQVTDPLGNVTSYSYSGNLTFKTDPASVVTRTVADVFGRVGQFIEDYGGANLPTYYGYDPLGDLTGVTKCADGSCSSGQGRNFYYDGLGRLIQAHNPESGTVYYSYGSKQMLQSRTDNRGSANGVTTYSYDGDNRLTGISYNDGTPPQYYCYDAVGNLTSAVAGTVSSGCTLANGVANNMSYDAGNRPSSSSVQFLQPQNSANYTYNFTYGYDLAGDLTSETYPSGRTVTTVYDFARRPQTLTGKQNGSQTTYVSAMAYWPHGAPNSWTYGNGVVPVDNYSNSLQPVQSLSMIGNNPSYYMFFSGNTWNSDNTVGSGLECYGQTVLWANMTCPTQTYTYDHMKRLTAVSDTYYSRNFQYDVYGNMSVSNYSSAPSVSSLMPLSAQNPYNASNNQLIAATYGDARGNMTAIGAVNSIQYDGESRQIYTSDRGTGQSIGYLYDGMGQRMERQIAGGATTFYVHDAFGNLAAEYNSSGVTPACGTCYLSYDELGSLRLVTDESAQIIARHDYLPFGEEILNGEAGRGTSFGFGNSATITQMFTGQERDGGTATLDYFNARHFSAVLGSMTQPDPMNAGGDILNPQSWNAYAYVGGNPLAYTDPSGMNWFTDIGSTLGSILSGWFGGCGVDFCGGTLQTGSVDTYSASTGGGLLTPIGGNGGGGGDPVYTATGRGKADIPTISFSLFSSLWTPAKSGSPAPKTCSSGPLFGDATYYNLRGKTASGQVFNPKAMTAAMYRPGIINLGQRVRVALQSDGQKGITVTVNDTGPFARGDDGKALRPLQPDPVTIIDLTPKAFRDLNGSLDAGRVPVIVTPQCP